MKKNLFQILACPVSYSGLSPMGAASLKSLNDAIAAGGITYRNGDTVSRAFTEALVSDNGKHAYEVADGIPVLLETLSVDMEQLS